MKPRNRHLVAMMKRKQGAHGKSNKAMRRLDKVRNMREYSLIG